MTIMPSRAGAGRRLSDATARAIPDGIYVGALVVLWVVCALLVGGGSEIPANDAWAYVRATESFLETGRIVRVPWTYAPVITNVVIGATFAKVFGFSQSVLLASSVFMGGLGMLALYALARLFGCSRPLAALISATFGFGIMHLGLSFTYMTDVPYTAFAVASLVAFTIGLRDKSLLAYGAGIAFTVAATLSRQTGVVMALGVLVTLALARIRTRRDLLIVTLSLVGLCFLAFVAEWLLLGWSNFGVFRALTSAFLGETPVYTLAAHSVASQACFGLIALPLVVPLALSSSAVDRRKLVVGAVLGVLAAAFVVLRIPHMPFWVNLIDPGGLGPIVVHCSAERPMLSSAVWWTLFGVSVMVGGWTLSSIGFWVWEVAWPERATHPQKLFLFVSTVLYLVPVLLRNPYFNRYLVPITPAWLLMLAMATGTTELTKVSYRVGVAGALALALFSSATTRDYLEHLGLRHALVTPLLKRKVNPAEIEGGMEFDGHYRYQRPGVTNLPVTRNDNQWLNDRGEQLLKGGSSWPHPERYLVSYCRNVPGFRPIESAERQRFLPPVTDRLYLLERADAR